MNGLLREPLWSKIALLVVAELSKEIVVFLEVIALHKGWLVAHQVSDKHLVVGSYEDVLWFEITVNQWYLIRRRVGLLVNLADTT